MKPTTTIAIGASALLTLSSSVFADAPAYKADKSFGQEEIKSPPVCVAVDAKDQLHVLLTDGTVVIYDAAGKKTGGFKAEMQPPPGTMTLADGKIYLLNSVKETKEMTFQGKKVKRYVSAGVGCEVYDSGGAKVGNFKLAEAAAATDAHFVGKELAVGDNEKSQIVFFELNGSEAKMTHKIDKVFRLCCGIFDFCPGSEPGTVVVANLGAFKVQTFKGTEKTTEFGQRGEKPEEFRGCCNPVNVGLLADGSLVTVEKDPTRVKIFDADRKTCTKVTGLTELVQGCSEIPVAIDSKGVIYLASSTKKCIVRCVPGVSDKPEPPEPKEEAIEIPEPSAAMKQIMEKVVPLMQAKEWAKAKTEAEAIIKANPDMAEDEKINILLGISVQPHMEKGDADAAIKEVETLLKAYPNSEAAKHLDEIKSSIKGAIEAMKEEDDGDEDAPDNADSKDAAPAKPETK